MIIAGSSSLVLLMLVLGMLCRGLWANTFKAEGGKWRFELYCFDFAIGVLVAATIFAFTLGSLGFDGFSVMDDLRLAGKRQEAFAFIAGIVFNLGNMLQLGAVSISGLAVAFPIGMGFAIVLNVVWNYILNPGSGSPLLFTGAGVVLVSIILAVLAFREFSLAKLIAAAQQGKTKSTRKKVSLRAAAFSLAGGLMIGSVLPFVQGSQAGENGLGPYSIGLLFAIGVFLSTFVFNLFFMNLPVSGEPIEIHAWFSGKSLRGKLSRHLWGILGGILLYIGVIASLAADRVEGSARVSTGIGYALGQVGIVIAAFSGIVIWKEFEGADAKVKTYLALMLILLLIGIGTVSTASLASSF
jgi:glucose uptake protein